MAAVSIRDFSYNPSAMFARVEKGETLEVTRHGKVIARLVPTAPDMSRYADLIAKGIRIVPRMTDDREFGRHEVPDGVDPLAVLLAERDSYYEDDGDA